jgi:hypothetical protein
MSFFHQNLVLFWHVEFGWTFAELYETLTYACQPILLFICGGGGGGGGCSQIFVASFWSFLLREFFFKQGGKQKDEYGVRCIHQQR